MADVQGAATLAYPAREEVFYGRGVWAMGEDGDMGLLIEGHGRHALAAANAYERGLLGPNWRAWEFPHTTFKAVWVVVRETCGCTEDQHTEHVKNGDAWGPVCEDCTHYGLPPCRDTYGWAVDYVESDASGAVAMTEVQW